MPFSSPRQSWLKIVLVFLGLTQLFGCSITREATDPVADDEAAAELADLFEGIGDDAPADEAVTPEQASEEVLFEEMLDASDEASLEMPTLISPVTIYGWEAVNGGAVGNIVTGKTVSRFLRPVAVAAQSEYIYVVDMGHEAVLRYDQATGRLESVLDLKATVKGEVADIYVAHDFSFYLTDTDGSRVLQYDRDGHLIQIFRNHFNLVKPVAIAVMDNADVIVADGYYDHLLRFNSMGKLIATYGGRGQGVAEFLNILTMAKGPDGFYIGSRMGRRVQVLSERGEYRYSFEEGKAVFPVAVVVDRDNRSFVADQMDGLIKVFDRGRLIATLGGVGTGKAQFKRINDLWLNDGFLYVADGLNGRIHMARLVPEKVVPMLNPVRPLGESVEELSTEIQQESLEPVSQEIEQQTEEPATP